MPLNPMETDATGEARPVYVIRSRAELARSRGISTRIRDGLSVLVLIALLSALAREVMLGSATDGSVWTLAPIAVLGYLAADLVSGLVHYLADTFGSIHTPILGPTFLKRFREHHVAPDVITTLDFFEVNGANSLISLPFAAALLWLPIRDGGAALTIGCFGLVFLLGVFLTNQFHRWAHLPARPRWLRWLHASGLVLTPEHHARHHVAPYKSHYCITSGMLNQILDRIGFFRRLERPLGALLVPLLGEAETIVVEEAPSLSTRPAGDPRVAESSATRRWTDQIGGQSQSSPP